ncbi:unnamed protein product [Symbiodinium sp. CCMP2592]|nr:unnamed protein product [Symbiodinium sp. CCMP2592]
MVLSLRTWYVASWRPLWLSLFLPFAMAVMRKVFGDETACPGRVNFARHAVHPNIDGCQRHCQFGFMFARCQSHWQFTLCGLACLSVNGPEKSNNQEGPVLLAPSCLHVIYATWSIWCPYQVLFDQVAGGAPLTTFNKKRIALLECAARLTLTWLNFFGQVKIGRLESLATAEAYSRTKGLLGNRLGFSAEVAGGDMDESGPSFDTALQAMLAGGDGVTPLAREAPNSVDNIVVIMVAMGAGTPAMRPVNSFQEQILRSAAAIDATVLQSSPDQQPDYGILSEELTENANGNKVATATALSYKAVELTSLLGIPARGHGSPAGSTRRVGGRTLAAGLTLGILARILALLVIVLLAVILALILAHILLLAHILFHPAPAPAPPSEPPPAETKAPVSAEVEKLQEIIQRLQAENAELKSQVVALTPQASSQPMVEPGAELTQEVAPVTSPVEEPAPEVPYSEPVAEAAPEEPAPAEPATEAPAAPAAEEPAAAEARDTGGMACGAAHGVLGTCKDVHMQLWPGSAVPLRPAILNAYRAPEDAWLMMAIVYSMPLMSVPLTRDTRLPMQWLAPFGATGYFEELWKHDLTDNRVKNMAAHALRVLTQVAAFLDENVAAIAAESARLDRALAVKKMKPLRPSEKMDIINLVRDGKPLGADQTCL